MSVAAKSRPLTTLERTCVDAVLRGEKLAVLARRLHYSESMCSMTLLRMRKRFGARSTCDLIAILMRAGDIE